MSGPPSHRDGCTCRCAEAPAAAPKSPARERRPYVSPRLEPLGDVRTLVLGASPGIGDSATNPHIFRP